MRAISMTAVHTYATYGDRTITLTVTDTVGVTSSMSRTVTLLPQGQLAT